VQEDKIMFTLDIAPKPIAEPVKLIVEEPVEATYETPIAPVQETIIDQDEATQAQSIKVEEFVQASEKTDLVIEEVKPSISQMETVLIEEEKPIVFEFEIEQNKLPEIENIQVQQSAEMPTTDQIESIKEEILERTNGFLVKPSVIYVDEVSDIVSEVNVDSVIEQPSSVVEIPSVVIEEKIEEEPVAIIELKPVQEEPEAEVEEEIMQIVFHDEPEIEIAPAKAVEEPVIPTISTVDSPLAAFDEAEAQKLRAAERLYKLRNLSFNFNAADPNNEYDSIPAYVRHNLQVHNTTLASGEKFYSSYSVGTDDQNNTQISTINTFLEGKKPD
jgi:cell division protein FtsZ